MENINWYPGHMKKTRELIQENLRLVDAVIEVIDARIPVSSRIPAQWSYSSDATAARYGGVKLQLSGMLMFFGSFRDVREKVLEPCTCSVV